MIEPIETAAAAALASLVGIVGGIRSADGPSRRDAGAAVLAGALATGLAASAVPLGRAAAAGLAIGGVAGLLSVRLGDPRAAVAVATLGGSTFRWHLDRALSGGDRGLRLAVAIAALLGAALGTAAMAPAVVVGGVGAAAILAVAWSAARRNRVRAPRHG